jgi:uncharacterized membrane protein
VSEVLTLSTEDAVQQIIVSATYADEIAARADYERLVEFREVAKLEHVHAALLVRDADGELRVEQHSFATKDVAGVGAVVGIVAGATLAAVFPPLGLAVAGAALAGGLGGALLGGAVGAAIGHLEGGVSKEQLADIGRVLRSGQAALVVSSDASHAADLHDILREAESPRPSMLLARVSLRPTRPWDVLWPANLLMRHTRPPLLLLMCE